MAFVMFLNVIKGIPLRLFAFPGTVIFQVFSWLVAPLLHLVPALNITSSEKASITNFLKIAS